MATLRSSSNPAKENRFARLTLEKLETRDCPAIITLSAVVSMQHQVQLSGQITDSPSAGIEIQFSGAVLGSVLTDINGAFSFLTNQATLGTVYAVGVNQGIEISNTANAQISSRAPQIIIDSATNANTVFWTFTGRVADEYVEGLTVTFGGAAAGLSTTVGADGRFSATFWIDEAASRNAFATAMTTDWWGLDSNLAVTTLL